MIDESTVVDDSMKSDDIEVHKQVTELKRVIDFAGYRTVVYDINSYRIFCHKVDVNQAAAMLGVQLIRVEDSNLVEMLYLATHPHLKLYALRNRVMLPENSLLRKHHDIRCKGPVVVSLLKANKRMPKEEKKMNEGGKENIIVYENTLSIPKSMKPSLVESPPIPTVFGNY